MPSPSTILFAGGGTGGHLYPGIAVAQALRQSRPDLRPLFLCTEKEIDKIILDAAGMEFIPQPIAPKRSSIGGLLKFLRGWRETTDVVRKIIRQQKPVACLGLGGYAAGVAVKRAALKDIPTSILNPDVIPGKANQYLMRYAQHVCCQFEQTADYVSRGDRGKLRVTGCPIRQDLRHLPPRAEALARLSLEPRLFTLVVTGASLGAQTVNQAVLEMLKGQKLQGWQVLHLAGKDHAMEVRAGYREIETAARVIDFTPAMADVWSVADLAISRCGASTCAELTACGVPSVLLPYPYHKDMHQRANAKVLADAGAAVLLEDEKDAKKNAQKMQPPVAALLYDATKRKAMSDAARKLGKPEAADAVAGIIDEMTKM